MKPAPMTFEQVIAQLEAWGSDSVRAIYARQGAGENTLGVKMGDLRGLAKKLKTNHPLALQLWATGSYEAMILAAIIMDSAQLSRAEIEAMLRPLTSYRLVDEFTYNVVAKTAFAEDLRLEWMNSPVELTGRAGWNLLIARLSAGAAGLDYEAILQQIETEMKAAPRYKQESMNQCLVEIGVGLPGLRQRCIQIGERLGRLDNRPIPKGCTSSYAPEWIAAVLKRQK